MMNRSVAGGVTVLLTCLLASLASGQTGSGQFELISATPAGAPAGGQAYFDQLPYDRGPQKISADNRYVVFASPSGQIVAGDTNGRQDIFLRDRATRITMLVSRAFDGSPANAESVMPRISANGRYVVFVSNATNLVPMADTNGFADVFVRDLQTGVTSLVSVSSAGVPANYGGYSPVDQRRRPLHHLRVERTRIGRRPGAERLQQRRVRPRHGGRHDAARQRASGRQPLHRLRLRGSDDQRRRPPRRLRRLGQHARRPDARRSRPTSTRASTFAISSPAS